eukprot:scaffold15.g4207.t1
MGDSWEDWDDESYAPPPPGGAPAAAAKSKFEDEDVEEDAPKWEDSVPKPQQAKAKPASKYDESRGVVGAGEGPLDDPEAEKLRQLRLIEEADYKATLELFAGDRDLDSFLPKSARDFEELAALVAAKYVLPHARSPHYKLLAKQVRDAGELLKHALSRPEVSSGDAKDIETSVAGLRSDKLREEKAAAAQGKKTSKKAALNVGKSGGSAGLDDYIYDDADDDGFEFM